MAQDRLALIGPKSLVERHQELLAGSEERHLRRREEWQQISPAPVSRYVYFLTGLVGVVVLGAIALAWYAMGSVMLLAKAGGEREDRLLDVIEGMTEAGVDDGIGLIPALVLILIIAACVVIPIIQALRGR